MDQNVDISKVLSGLMEIAPAGFAIALHIRFTSPAFMFQTYPKTWIEEYSRDGLLAHDPMVAWAFSNEGHVAWSALATQDKAGVLERAASHGLRHGLAVSVVRQGGRSLGGFARSDREFTPEEASTLEAAVGQLHDTTDPSQPIPQDVRESLRRLSVMVTHP